MTRAARCGIAALLFANAMAVTAQTLDPPSGFALIGHIERFTLDTPASITSSARMTVRGIEVQLPSNLVITMPGGYLTAQQLFKGRDFRQPVDPARSGLALIDLQPADLACPAAAAFAGRQCPLPPAEAEIIGNIIDGVYRAGVVRISQGALHIGSGFVRDILADGTLIVGADRPADPANPLAGTARIRLNDPEGIYGPKAVGQDQRFALDPGNSPIHARTGFPLCVPRSANDALCPAGNRPAVNAASPRRFTCGAQQADATAPALAGCKPHLPVPLVRGDHIIYAGRLDKDTQGYFVSAHGVEAELGVYTSPGVDPAYVFVEEAIQGTVGERYPDIPQEETSRFKLVGFTSDPSRTIDVAIFDDDANVNALPPTLAPTRLATRIVPTNGAQLGRFKMIWSAKEDARIVRRAVRVTLSPGTSGPPTMAPGKNSRDLTILPGASQRGGYAFGSYEAPISEYISPEVTRFGVKGYPPPVNFENFCFLKRANRVESIEPSLTDATGWVEIPALALSPPVAVRAQSQMRGDGVRVCGD